MGLPPALPSPLLICSHLLLLPPSNSEALAEEGSGSLVFIFLQQLHCRCLCWFGLDMQQNKLLGVHRALLCVRPLSNPMACGKLLSWVMGKPLAPHSTATHGSAAWAMNQQKHLGI